MRQLQATTKQNLVRTTEIDVKTFKEFRKKNIKEEKDKGEYDYEGDMAKSQLRSIVYNANMLHDMLEDDTNLPEWVQSKITLAEDYIVTAAQYMQSQMSEEVAQFDEVTKKIYVGAVKQATDPDSSKGDSDKIIARAKKQHGEKFAKDLKGIEGKSHFVRANHSMGYDTLRDRGSPARVTQSGKANKQDVKAIKNKITSRLGKHKTPNLPEANLTPYRNTERGVQGTKRNGLPRVSNAKQFFRPPEGFTKKGVEKGKGTAISVSVYKKKK
jgi:hypothetical protein